MYTWPTHSSCEVKSRKWAALFSDCKINPSRRLTLIILYTNYDDDCDKYQLTTGEGNIKLFCKNKTGFIEIEKINTEKSLLIELVFHRIYNKNHSQSLLLHF